MKKPKLQPLLAAIVAEAERRGMTMYAVSKAAGVGANVVGRVFAGDRPDPQLSTVVKLAAAVGLRLELGKDAD